MPATYHSKICQITHSAMEQLYAAGLLDGQSMAEFDLLCRTDLFRETQAVSESQNGLIDAPSSVPAAGDLMAPAALTAP